MNEEQRWNMVTDMVAALCDAGHDVTHAEVIQALDMVGWDMAPAVSQWKDKRIAALESELATLKAATAWTTIVPDNSGTLPPSGLAVDVSCTVAGKVKPVVIGSFHSRLTGWHYYESNAPLHPSAVPYAWRDRPDPAPYPEEESE